MYIISMGAKMKKKFQIIQDISKHKNFKFFQKVQGGQGPLGPQVAPPLHTTPHHTRNLTSWCLITFLVETFRSKSSLSLAIQQIGFTVCIAHKSRKHQSPSALELVLMESIAWRPPSPIRYLVDAKTSTKNKTF